MNKRGNTRLFAVFGALLAALLTACGATEETRPITAGAGWSTLAAAGINICVSCHTVQTGEWLQTPHANLDPSSPNDLSYAGSPSFGDIAPPRPWDQANCGNCHNLNNDGLNVDPESGGVIGTTDRPIVGCEACHGDGGNHNGWGPIGPYRLSWTTIGTAPMSMVSPQFNTCTSCHELLNLSAADPPNDANPATAAHDATGLYPDPAGFDAFETITDTHYAKPGNWPATQYRNTLNINGYAMDYAGETVCSDCHNPHEKNTVNGEWAQSAHADKTAAGAWAHYNWTCDGSDFTTCGYVNPPANTIYSDRRGCQRCHTTSGFVAYITALRTGGAYTPPLAFTQTFKPEMIKCNGCHTNNKGSLRNPGPITADYGVNIRYPTNNDAIANYASVSTAYPDVSNSNICMACHTGMESGDSIKQLNAQAGKPTVDFNTLAFISSHYLTGGGTVFTATGYEWDGRSYANPTSYLHDKIGSSAYANTGTAGPCIGCHMSRSGGSGDHLFLPVGRDANGNVQGIASEVCFVCHIMPSAVLLDSIQEQEAQFAEALEALKREMDRKGFGFYESYPYIHTVIYTAGTATVTNGSTTVTGSGTAWASGAPNIVTGSGTGSSRFRAYDGTDYVISAVNSPTQITLATNYTGPSATNTTYAIIRTGSANAMKDWDPTDIGGTNGGNVGKHNLGAAFNFNLLEHDGGAYVHNSRYVKRLIYDSIDWLDDYSMNYSVGNTLTNLTTEPYKAEAMTYILPGGVAAPYTTGDRP